jgi:hypothetical protein
MHLEASQIEREILMLCNAGEFHTAGSNFKYHNHNFKYRYDPRATEEAKQIKTTKDVQHPNGSQKFIVDGGDKGKTH